jgi:hypothetical protein
VHARKYAARNVLCQAHPDSGIFPITLSRNCNHFTETLATAIILQDGLAESGHPKLKSYPEWINRLANTSKMVVSHDDDIVPCNPLEEARKAVGADQKVAWGFSNNNDKSATANNKRNSSGKSTSKKELTEKQKAALAKIRGNK